VAVQSNCDPSGSAISGKSVAISGARWTTLARVFWRALDRLDYWLTQAILWLVDAVCGPLLDGDTLD
jgi:hypothetical protein